MGDPFNLKQMAQVMCFLQENEIDSFDELAARADAAVTQFNGLGDSIKAAEQRMQEIAALKKHIINYSKTREVYVAYRKAGYSKKFLEGHREAITLHKAAKEAFEQLGLKKLPRVKELNAEYAQLLEQKRAAYPAYRKARTEMQEYLVAQKVVAVLLKRRRNRRLWRSGARRNSAPIRTDDLGGAGLQECRPAPLFSFSRKHRGGRFRLHAGRKPRLSLQSRDNSVREPNA